MSGTMVKLILMFAKQGNMKALRKLSAQVKIPVKEMLQKASSSMRYMNRNRVIEKAKMLGNRLPKGAIQQKVYEIRNSPNLTGNLDRVIRGNINKYR